jgi:hypothetical protein
VKNEALSGNVSLWFLGNGVDIYADAEDYIAITEIYQTVQAIPGSRIIRGNHESNTFMAGRHSPPGTLDLYSLNAYHSEDGVLITHNLDTMIGLERWIAQDDVEVSDRDELNSIILKKCGVYGSYGEYSKPENIGKLRSILLRCVGMELEEGKDYLDKVQSMMAENREHLAFVGHEHSIDRDTTTCFELGGKHTYGLIMAGQDYVLPKSATSIIAVPHFFGAPKFRGGIPSHKAVHYLEFAPETGNVRYGKYIPRMVYKV